jgi:hypothetical protein
MALGDTNDAVMKRLREKATKALFEERKQALDPRFPYVTISFPLTEFGLDKPQPPALDTGSGK